MSLSIAKTTVACPACGRRCGIYVNLEKDSHCSTKIRHCENDDGGDDTIAACNSRFVVDYSVSLEMKAKAFAIQNADTTGFAEFYAAKEND